MIKILYIAPGPAPLESDSAKNKFFYLSKYFSGDILHPIWGIKGKNAPQRIAAIKKACGNFNYHYTFSFHLPKPIRFIKDFLFYLIEGLRIFYFQRKFDIIITYGPFKTGLAGYIIKLITGTKLIVEMPGNPEKAFDFEENKKNLIQTLKSKSGSILTKFLLNRCDHIKLLYPRQVDAYKIDRKQNISVFHNFVPITILEPSDIDEKYILFLGFPWYLKGVDILIKAFKKIHPDFPDYKLKIVGHCPDKSYFEFLSKDCPAIELNNAVKHEVAMDLLKKCTVFVLPSRTEAMGRVLLEAMATKKAIIASDVDGIPYYIKHESNGLLFRNESVEILSEQLNSILADGQLRSRLSENGYKKVHRCYNEENFVQQFKLMADKTL